MPVIGLSLAIVPIVAILAARALLKLLFLPIRGAYALARSRPGRSASVIALCAASFLAWSQLASGGHAASAGPVTSAAAR